MTNLLRLFNTVRYLKPQQILGQIRTRLPRGGADPRPAPPLRTPSAPLIRPARKGASLVGMDLFRFVNQQHQASWPATWKDPSLSRLWLYNLHYFDDLNAFGAENRTSQHQLLLERWLQDNPPGTKPAWEPFPTSLRIVNWIKWALRGHTLADNLRHSLAVQCRWLASRLEYHLLGNHLLANAKALVYAGSFFAETPAAGETTSKRESQSWLERGLAILDEQLPEQILPDGGHFELSPMYHSLVLEDLLDLLNLAGAFGAECPQLADRKDRWTEIVGRMRRWLAAMCHPDGQIALLNDSAFDIAPKPVELEDYSRRLGLPPLPTLDEPIVCLANSGYVRLQNARAVAILDVARVGPDYLPGHAHADTLTFELSLDGRRLIVDSGTSQYALGPLRDFQRSTPAHNTVTVEGQNSSEVWSSFRVARRAYPHDLIVETASDGSLRVECSHDGYRRLRGRVTHRRQWSLDTNGLDIRDELTGRASFALATFFLHPEVACELSKDSPQATLIMPQSKIKFQTTGHLWADAATYHPEFNVSIPNRSLRVSLINNAASHRLEF